MATAPVGTAATKLVSRSRRVRYRGQFYTAPAVAAVHADEARAKATTVDADVIHGGGKSQTFWLRMRTWGLPAKLQGGNLWNHRNRAYVPTWDRVAQVMLMMAQPVPRQTPEMAFRLFAVFLKVMMLQRIGDMAIALFPITRSHDLKGLLEAGRVEREKLDREAGKATPGDAAKAEPAGSGGDAAAPVPPTPTA